MKPISISEQLMYITVRIVTKNGSTGTGSFFEYSIDGKKIPIIITNKHVINNNPDETISFYIHLLDAKDDPNDNLSIEMETHWNFHPSKDLCFCYAAKLFDEVRKRLGKKIFYHAVTPDLVPTAEKLLDLDAFEELVMIGYPIGLWDTRNNLPIFRKGYTACHPGVDFNTDGIGLVDMACFPGSSGSPIFILNIGPYYSKGKGTIMGKPRVLLLGYLYAGPQFSASGDLIVQAIPTGKTKLGVETQVPANLGYYVKAVELDAFKSIIEADFLGQQK